MAGKYLFCGHCGKGLQVGHRVASCFTCSKRFEDDAAEMERTQCNYPVLNRGTQRTERCTRRATSAEGTCRQHTYAERTRRAEAAERRARERLRAGEGR